MNQEWPRNKLRVSNDLRLGHQRHCTSALLSCIAGCLDGQLACVSQHCAEALMPAVNGQHCRARQSATLQAVLPQWGHSPLQVLQSSILFSTYMFYLHADLTILTQLPGCS